MEVTFGELNGGVENGNHFTELKPSQGASKLEGVVEQIHFEKLKPSQGREWLSKSTLRNQNHPRGI